MRRRAIQSGPERPFEGQARDPTGLPVILSLATSGNLMEGQGKRVPSLAWPAAAVSSAEGQDEARRVFFGAFQEGSEGPGPDIEALCHAHPAQASELRILHAHWKRARAALGADSLRPVGSPERYRVLGEIAEGGMGVILSVWDPALGRALAMKVLRRAAPGARDGSARERAMLRLLHEARILGCLQHPSIVPVHEVGELENGEPYFTMLHVRGLALSEILPRLARGEDGWNLPRAIRVLLSVCEAVAHAHAQGIVHRDLKPANVMVGPFGETYVMDWGLARAGDFAGEADLRLPEERGADSPAPPEERAERLLLTMEGDVLGTPAYMAPEQARGQLEIGPRSDVYSAGAILHHLLAGEAPYEGGRSDSSPREILARVLAGPPAPLARLAPRAPAELVAICEKAMAREPGNRYATMLELAEDLRAWLEVRVVRAHAHGAWAELKKWMRRHTAVVGLLAALLVIVIGSAVAFVVLGGKAAVRGRQAATAQFDALRRLNALRPMVPWGATLPSFRDDFEDGFLDRRWMASGRTDLVSERNGRLRLDASADGEMATEVILDPYVNVIRGDFDVSVDFFLEDFTVPSSGERAAMLIVDEAHTGAHVMEIGRHVEHHRSDVPPTTHYFQAYDEKDLRPVVEGDEMQGRLRLARAGSRISGHYWRDGWQELVSKDCTGAPVRLRFVARNWSTGESFAVEFDNLDVRTTFEMPSKLLTSFRDDFSDAAIDSRLVIRADAGIAAELDGKLYLEKLQGRKGEVAVDLAAWNWVLRGDFSISLDFELVDFPGSGDGNTSLSLTLYGVHGGRRTLQILATPAGRSYRFLRRWGDAQEPFDGSSGKLRIERRGPVISYQYWRDGWQELYAGGFPGVDSSFKIVLSSSEEDPVVVAIDNLEATSMIRRADVNPTNPTAEQAGVLRIEGPQGGRVGSVGGVGDIDRDGIPDFAVGASRDSSTGKDSGSVWIHSGRDASVLAHFQGGPGDTFGLDIESAGDLDADGYPDILVSAPSFQSSPVLEYVEVLSGRYIAERSGPAELYTLNVGSLEDSFGVETKRLGDLDGDGTDDLFVGARDANEGRGTAFLFTGRDGSELFRRDGVERQDAMGNDAVGLGDVDCDGFDDFVVTAAREEGFGRTDAGRAHVLLGGPRGALGRALYPPLEGARKDDWFGASAARVGDVDGDGAADFVVGASGQADSGATTGYARMFSGRSGARLWTVRGDAVGDYFGRGVTGPGDVNGDGVPDVLVGAPYDCSRGKEAGMVRVVSGNDGAVLGSFDGCAGGSKLGSGIAGPGDLDGDGLDDLLVGAPGAYSSGAVYLIPGKFVRDPSNEAQPRICREQPEIGHRDDFSDRIIDSHLVIHGDAGSASERDGRLLLEKQQGRKGSVAVELSSWNHVLRGDFSLSFDFELADFPRTGDGSTSFSLMPAEGGVFGHFQFVAMPEGRCYRFLRDGVDVREPLEGSSGKLRIERAGRALSFQTWRDGWSELFELPEVDSELDMFLWLELQSPDEEAVVVAVDNLEVASMLRRADVDPKNPTAEAASLLRIDGPSAGAALGSVSGVGDIDRDGIPDFAVGAERDLAGGKDAGSVWIHSGRDSSVLARFQGGPGDTFGHSITAAGDVNADGFPDLLVGAPSFKPSPAREYAKVLSGRYIADRKGPAELHTFTIGSVDDEYGFKVSGLGDVDGDGHDDVFVGARKRNESRGTAFVYSGRDGSELFRREGAAKSDGMGQDAAGLGEVDRDGCDDFVLAVPWEDPDGLMSAGRVHVLLGGRPGEIGRARDPVLAGDKPDAALGVSVARIGDVDGDGIADFAAGACGQAEGGNTAGYARMFSGRDGRLLWTVRGDTIGDYFGRLVDGPGDLDGDGVPDVLVNAGFDCNRGPRSGMVRAFSGRDGSVLASFDGCAAGDNLGFCVAGVGDVDGDGLADFLVGATGTDPGGLMDAGSVYLIPGSRCASDARD